MAQNQQPTKLLPDESVIKHFAALGPEKVKLLLSRLLGVPVEVITTKCCEVMLSGALEHTCLHAFGEEDGVYLRCLLFLIGRYNTQEYVVVTTDDNVAEYRNVYNLPLVVADLEENFVLRAPRATQLADDAEVKRFANKIKSARSSAKKRLLKM